MCADAARKSLAKWTSPRKPPHLPSPPPSPRPSPPRRGRGGKPTGCRRSSLAPAEGERVGVRGRIGGRVEICPAYPVYKKALSSPGRCEMVGAEAMSEFKFACPVCGQHITAGSSASGSQIVCPTCFQKIVVPQAPDVRRHQAPGLGCPGSQAPPRLARYRALPGPDAALVPPQLDTGPHCAARRARCRRRGGVPFPGPAPRRPAPAGARPDQPRRRAAGHPGAAQPHTSYPHELQLDTGVDECGHP